MPGGRVRALIVEDGASRGALAAVRALHCASIGCGLASPRRGVAARSRYVGGWHPVPPGHESDFVGAVADVCARHGYEIVLPAGDVEAIALSAQREQLGAELPLPPHEDVVTVMNKLRLARLARHHDIPMPPTEEATDALLDGARYPLVIKPDMQWAPGRPPPSARLDVRIVDGRAQARERASQLRAGGAVPVAQPVVRGRLTACAAVVDGHGEPQGLVAQEATTMWPPGRGISAAAISVDPGRLAPHFVEVVRVARWRGLLQVQFLDDGSHLTLLDVNVRLYGSLSLAVAAGANLPALWAGRAAPSRATPGVRYQWLEGDLKRALRERSGGIARDLLGVAHRSLTSNHSISSWRDPVPMFAAAMELIRGPRRRNRR